MEINLHVWCNSILFLTILYITWETGNMESSVLLSLSASCLQTNNNNHLLSSRVNHDYYADYSNVCCVDPQFS